MADPRPLLLCAIPRLDAGGPDRVMHEILHGLPRGRFRIALAVGEAGGRYFDRLPADVAPHVIGGGRYPALRLARLIDRLRPAVLFTTLRMNMTAGLALMLARHRPAHVLRQANAIAEDFAMLKRGSLVKHRIAEQATWRMLERAAAIVAQSPAMAQAIRERLPAGVRIETIGNPVDPAAIAAQAAAQHGARPAGDPAIVSVGRLAAQKGYDLLIAALPAIRAVHGGAQLTILGEGPDRAALAAQAASLNLTDVVHLSGQSDAALATVAQADLFVSSSRYEGFSNAMAEALALGTPVVATPCAGATRDLILNGRTGWLTDAIDPAAIADAVLAALAGNRAAVAAAARDHVARDYGPEAIFGAYEQLFAELAAIADTKAAA